MRATVGITRYYDHSGFVINQMHGKHNKSIDQCHQDYVKEWLDKPEVQQWFTENYKSNQLASPPEMLWL